MAEWMKIALVVLFCTICENRGSFSWFHPPLVVTKNYLASQLTPFVNDTIVLVLIKKRLVDWLRIVWLKKISSEITYFKLLLQISKDNHPLSSLRVH